MKKGVIFGLTLISTAALAEEKATPPAAPKERLICTEDLELGSRLRKKKICMTAREWKEQREQTRQMMDQGRTHQTNPQG